MSGHAVAEPRVYQAGLAVGADRVEAVVFDLPGCACVAADEDAVCGLLPVVIAEHLAWLDQHGEVTRDAFPFEVRVAERVEVGRLSGIADGEFCFDDDLTPVTADDVAAALGRLRYSRQDLLALVRHLPQTVLDWTPPASAVVQDDWMPGVRSIGGILGHIASSDSYYASKVGDATWHGVRPATASDVFSQRQLSVERLQALTKAELAARWLRRYPGYGDDAEHWTVRKVLRRMIAHERAHTREIGQHLAWLLLGAPTLAITTRTAPV